MTDVASTTGIERNVRGEDVGKCCYENCESEASVLVKFEETKPKLHVWFCAPHAGNAVKKHDDACTVDTDTEHTPDTGDKSDGGSR